ncbi:uncharacterized protein LOC144377074 [Ictidomys tridecemlineatus]
MVQAQPSLQAGADVRDVRTALLLLPTLHAQPLSPSHLRTQDPVEATKKHPNVCFYRSNLGPPLEFATGIRKNYKRQAKQLLRKNPQSPTATTSFHKPLTHTSLTTSHHPPALEAYWLGRVGGAKEVPQ